MTSSRAPLSVWALVLIPLMTRLSSSSSLPSSSAPGGETITMDIKMPHAHPHSDDAYLCHAIKVPAGENYIVNYEPLADGNVAHHMLLFGCDQPATSHETWTCGTTCHGKSRIMFAWAKNAPPPTIPEGVGFKVGAESQTNYFVLQIHYLHKEKEGSEGDESGLRIYYTPERQKYMAGIYILGSPGGREIPGRRPKFSLDASCRYSENFEIHPFAFRTHAHTLSRVVTGYIYNGTYTMIGKGNPQWPQAFYPMDKVYTVKSGDYLLARCTYNSSDRERTTYIGETHNDEMCNFYIMYYTDFCQDCKDFMNCWGTDYQALSDALPPGSDTQLPHNALLEAAAHGHHHHPMGNTGGDDGAHDDDKHEEDDHNHHHMHEHDEETVAREDEKDSEVKGKLNMASDAGFELGRGGGDNTGYMGRDSAESAVFGGGFDRQEDWNPIRANDYVRRNYHSGGRSLNNYKYPLNRNSKYDWDRGQYPEHGAAPRSDTGLKTYEDYNAGNDYDYPISDPYAQFFDDVANQRSRGRTRTTEAPVGHGRGSFPASAYNNIRDGRGPGYNAWRGQEKGYPADKVGAERTKNTHVPKRGRNFMGESSRASPKFNHGENNVDIEVLPVSTPIPEDNAHESQANSKEPNIKATSPTQGNKVTVVPAWPRFPPEVTLGQVGGVCADSKGKLHIFHRGAHVWDASSFDGMNVFTAPEHPIQVNAVLTVEVGGIVVNQWGKDRFYLPHGLHIDQKDNIWLTDVALHQVFKYNAGEYDAPALTLGKRFVPGSDTEHFCKPTSVAVLPTGEFFVADGYCNGRILKFSPDGKVIHSWGEISSSKLADGFPPPSTFSIPHSLTLLEDKDQLCVADRENRRIQCFDYNGKFLRQIHSKDMGNVYGVAYSKVTGILYAVDGRGHYNNHPNFHGFSIDPMSGTIISKWAPDSGFSQPHDLAVNPAGDAVFVGEIGPNKVWKFTLPNTGLHHSVKKGSIHPGSHGNKGDDRMEDAITKSEEAGDLGASMVIGALLIIPVIIVVLITVFLRLRKSGKLGFFDYKKQHNRRFNLGEFFSNHKGFNRLSTDGSDQELDHLNSDSEVEEYSANIDQKA